MDYFATKMQPLVGIVGEVQQVTEGGWNLEKLNEETYRLADSAGFGAAALAELGLSLGLITEEEAAYGIAIATMDAAQNAMLESLDPLTTSVLQFQVAMESAREIAERGPIVPVDEWDASAFFDSGGDTPLGFEPSAITTAFNTAMTDVQSIINGVTDPDDPNIVTVDMEYQSVIDGQGEINDIKADLEKPVIVSVQFISSGKQDIIDAIEEFGGS